MTSQVSPASSRFPECSFGQGSEDYVLSEGLLDAGTVVSAIDEVLDSTVIVTGALPPEGRYLDLLVSDEQGRRLPEILAAKGFLARGRKVAPRRLVTQQWVRIEGSSAL